MYQERKSDLNPSYRLREQMEVEYERDKGYRPSGYANLSLVLIPANGEDNRILAYPSEESRWIIRETKDTPRYTISPSPTEMEKILPDFIKMIIEGIQEGALIALSQSLNKPVVGVQIVITSCSFDLVYSTKMAFYLAAEESIKFILQQALQNNKIF